MEARSDPRAIIAAIRDGDGLDPEEARWFGKALTGAAISDAQAGAFAMAVRLRGLNGAARVALTEGMRDSGDVLKWDLPGPVLDKHSTGGVGDPVSLLLAPALATGRVAPSDKRLYAIRDVTASVDSIDLITASILSKKLAAGLDGLVLDVKTGSGAFMARMEDAKALADALVRVANGAGCKTSALITDMSQPLASAAGNAVEIRAVMEALTDPNAQTRLREVVIALGGAVLQGAGLENGIEEALNSGRAAELFAKMVHAMGGPSNFAESWQHVLPEATVLREVTLEKSGFIKAVDTRALGEVVVHLGGGRLRDGDRIDPAVGLSAIARIGDKVTVKTPVAMVHASDEARADQAVAAVRAAFKLGTKAVPAPALIHAQVTP